MGFFSSDIKSMEDLYRHQLRDIYYAENQILKALPDLIDRASPGPLRAAFQKHLEETGTHVERLEKVFDLLSEPAKGTSCAAIDGLIEETNNLIGEVNDPEVLDAAIAAAAQAVEHYEITRYGTLIAWSKELGRADCAELLETTLEEEKAADQALTVVAEERLNRAA